MSGLVVNAHRGNRSPVWLRTLKGARNKLIDGSLALIIGSGVVIASPVSLLASAIHIVDVTCNGDEAGVHFLAHGIDKMVLYLRVYPVALAAIHFVATFAGRNSQVTARVVAYYSRDIDNY